MYGAGFDMQAVIHQGSVFSPMLFIIILETSCELCTGCSQELLYANVLVILANTMDEILPKLNLWNKNAFKLMP